MEKIPAAILAATGTVGQRFVQLLADHPWFEIVAVTGSQRSVGRPYGEAVNWVLGGEVPAAVAGMVVSASEPTLEARVLFSALPTAHARALEPVFAAAGYAVVTNASAFRMAPDVPLLIPEINPEHTALIASQRAQRGWHGFIVASPNCSTTSAVLPLKIWHETYGVESAVMTTLQAISGAGYPGVPSLDIMDNVVPYIGGEDEKLEKEPLKLLGAIREGRLERAALQLSAQANRVPVIDGHLASVSVKLAAPATPEEAIACLEAWQPPAVCQELPSSPARPLVYRHEPDRPQPRLDRDTAGGLAWTVGKVRPCAALDLRFVSLTHNTLRGAASGAILNAELLKVQGYLTS